MGAAATLYEVALITFLLVDGEFDAARTEQLDPEARPGDRGERDERPVRPEEAGTA